MRSRLPKYSGPAKRFAVRGRLLSFLVLIGILFGGVVAPAVAHERGAEFDHAGEVLDIMRLSVVRTFGADRGVAERSVGLV